MKFSDEQLMAFADGELEGEARAAIEAARAGDPELARRIEHYRAQRELLRRSFERVLDEPVPERLLRTARTAPIGSKVVGLEDARAARAKPAARTWAWREWTAVAASLLVGALVGRVMLGGPEQELLAARDGRLVASGALEAALDDQASGVEAPIAIGFTYRAKSGGYCRTFAVSRGGGLAGIACRVGGNWNVHALTEGTPAADSRSTYRMAGGELPPLLVQAVEAQIDGEPLDAEAESAAQRTDWRE